MIKRSFQKNGCFERLTGMAVMTAPHWYSIAGCLLLLGCSFKFEVTSQKTALENQVLGTYQQLEDELVLVTTVRGSGKSNAKSDLASSVSMAGRNQKFNLDDIEELKSVQILGETNQGKLAVLAAGKGLIKKASKFQLKLAKVLVNEENTDRKVIWKHIISENENLTQADLGKVKKNYALQKTKESQAGHWYQTENGEWLQKSVEN